MLRIAATTLAFLLCLSLAAQDTDSRKKFAGSWEARFNDRVICTITVKAGDPIAGEMVACNINVDEDGNLREGDSAPPDEASPLLNPKIQGDTLSFEDKDGDNVMRFELKLVRDGQAELTVLDTPVDIKPIPFARK